MTNKTVFIFSGEHSGDRLGAELVQIIKQTHPNWLIKAMGGNALKATDTEIFIDNKDLDIIGVTEVFKHLPKLLTIWKEIKSTLLAEKPDLIILIDYPGLNLRIAKFAKKHGIKVLYYVSPQIWAWKTKRLQHIKRDVDHMALLFPFESKIYDAARIPNTVVGHPMLKRFQQLTTTDDARNMLGLSLNRKTLAILPGSRSAEIKRLMPVILQTLPLIKQQFPDLQCVIAQADSIKALLIPKSFADYVKVIQKQTDTVVAASDAVISASGTATLEIGLAQKPLVIIYKTSLLTYQIAKRVLNTKHIGLCNIVAEREIAPELIQHQLTAATLSQTIIPLLNQTSTQPDLRPQLGQEYCPERLLSIIESLMA